jgi:hypothetical protein
LTGAEAEEAFEHGSIRLSAGRRNEQKRNYERVKNEERRKEAAHNGTTDFAEREAEAQHH